MGYYINHTQKRTLGTSFNEKCDGLIEAGAIEVSQPTNFQEGIICVVNNGLFAAAGYAFSEDELNVFRHPDGRPKRWFIWDKAKEYAK